MNVFVAAAGRSPFGLRNGQLSGWHPVDLLSEVVKAVMGEWPLSVVDAAVGSCSSPIGEAAANVTRNALLAAGFDESVPASTIDAGATGGMVALDQAVAQLASGRLDVMLVTAVDSATRVPPGATSGTAVGKPYGPAVHHRFEEVGGLAPPGMVAEQMAARAGLSAEMLGAYVEESVRRARQRRSAVVSLQARTAAGRPKEGVLDSDELRARQQPEGLSPMFLDNGVITAATTQADGDGAVVLLLCNERGAAQFGRSPKASISALVVEGVSPITGSNGGSVAQAALKAGGRPTEGVTVIVSEDSAVTPLALADLLEVSVNPQGGFLHTALPASAAGLAELVDVLNSGPDQPFLVVTAGSSWTAAAVLAE